MPTTPILQLPYPASTDSADVPRDIQALAAKLDPMGFVPVGATFMWVAVAAPAGYLLMQGQTVDAATYPTLATLLGQAAGLVTIPDMRGRFPMGVGAAALNSTGGAASVALSVAEMPSHSHNGATGAADRSLSHYHQSQYPEDLDWNGAPGGSTLVQRVARLLNTSADATPDHLHAIAAQGGGGAHNNVPPYRALNFIIRAG